MDFCHNYSNISSQIVNLNRGRLDLSRFVWVQGFGEIEGVEDEIDEDITKFFTGQGSEFEGILSITRVFLDRKHSQVFTLTFLSTTTATSFLSRDIKYRGRTLTCFLLRDLEMRIKLECRARNYRDETMYREGDMDRRLAVIVDTDKNVEKEDLLEILAGEDKLVAGLEHVLRCEIDEGHSRYFSGLYILTFKEKLSVMNPGQCQSPLISYVGKLKDYITHRSQIIKENPIHIKVLSPPPLPPAPLSKELFANCLASEDLNRFNLELSGFSSECRDMREYVIKIMKLEYVEGFKEKVSEANWFKVEDRDGESLRFTARISLNLYDIKRDQFVKTWNDKNIKIGGCNIRARIAQEQKT
eukprot:GFUD01030080.1.p1 GENE.GFUD01030080.1~~GFUD01030080.1.p1  ORF type:complete len:357 (+),score=86.62 GFUD01030080.1:94-1164(+)